MATPAEQVAVIRELSGVERPLIVDLGAYRAEEYREWMHRLNPSRYIAVEPDPRNAQAIRAADLVYRTRPAVDDVRYQAPASPLELYECAIAAQSGQIEFLMCDNTSGQAFGSGSVRKPTGHLMHFPWCTFERKLKVNAQSLNSLYYRADIERCDLLWCDIQGAERDMIAGGKEALALTRLLMIEAESVEMYAGQALKPELLRMLDILHWEVIEDFGYNVLLRNLKPK